jgi:hypothetical protein
MIEARMLALESSPRFLTTKSPNENAVQEYIDLDWEYSAATAGAD